MAQARDATQAQGVARAAEPARAPEESGGRGATELAIETVALTKKFGTQTAVSEIDLAVPRGSVFGFLGPNGSGKTTSIRMLLGLIQATSGHIKVLGQPMPDALRDVLPRVGALVEGPAFYPYLSGEANLRRLDSADRGASSATRSARVASALERVGLTHAGSKKAGAYSLGMKQRLGLANALLQPRDLLVLDEPTNGLDPQGTREVRALVRSFAAEGITVFVSSHLLAEIEQLCTHAAIMSGGKLVAQGTLANLRGSGHTRVRIETPDAQAAAAALTTLGLVPALVADSGAVTADIPPTTNPDTLMPTLVEAGVRVRGFSVQEPSLEERFVELTGEGFDVVQ